MKNDWSCSNTCTSLLSVKDFLNWFQYKTRRVLGRRDLMSQETATADYEEYPTMPISKFMNLSAFLSNSGKERIQFNN